MLMKTMINIIEMMITITPTIIQMVDVGSGSLDVNTPVKIVVIVVTSVDTTSVVDMTDAVDVAKVAVVSVVWKFGM